MCGKFTKFRGFFVKWLILLSVVLCLVWFAPMLIPGQLFKDTLEKYVTDFTGQPCHVAAVKFGLLPRMSVGVDDVVLGEHEDLTIKSIRVLPQVFSWLRGERAIEAIEFEAVHLKPSAIPAIKALVSRQSEKVPASPSVRVARIELRGFTLEGSALPPVNIDVQLSALNAPEHISVSTLDGNLTLEDTPVMGASDEGGLGDSVRGGQTNAIQHVITITGKDWDVSSMTPKVHALVVQSLHGAMTYQGDQLHIAQMTAKVFGGEFSLHGDVLVMPMPSISLQFKSQQIAIEQALRAFALPTRLSGLLVADGNVSAKAGDWASLLSHGTINAQFEIQHGQLQGVDLSKAATLFVKTRAQGGETQFDRLSGNLHAISSAKGMQYGLSDLRVESGLLQADGQLHVSNVKALDGTLNVALKNSVNMVAVPLAIGGTVSEPSVMPTKAAMAGAAVGTAVLGPGVGTSVGIKASSMLDKVKGLFGSGK